MPVRFVLILFLLMLTLPVHTMAEKKLAIYTVNYPLTYFAERIGGDFVNVIFPTPPGIDPAFWTPDTATVRKYQKADLIILNGAGYEKWTKKVSLPMLRIVDTSKAFKDKLIHIKNNATHSHGPSGDHSHGGTAFTTWLDFSQAALQAEAIYKAMSRKQPANKDVFAKNFELLKKDLLELDVRMKTLSAQKPNLPLVGSHPIYQYMARRYKMNLQMVMWEPGEDPGEVKWKHLQEMVQAHPAKWMIWEGKPLPESSARLQKMKMQSQVFNPCFARPESGDFLLIMQQNVKNMGFIFK